MKNQDATDHDKDAVTNFRAGNSKGLPSTSISFNHKYDKTREKKSQNAFNFLSLFLIFG